jgi:beta-lactamase regulating signal transducer with metallopeptidase domain
MSNLLLQAAWCFAASLLLPLLVWAAMPLLPRSAALRHLVWVAVFAVLLFLPLLVLIVPSQILLHPSPPSPVAPLAAVAAPRGWQPVDALALLPLVWLAGVIWNLARLALGLFGLGSLRRQSTRFDDMRDVRLADDGPLTFGWRRPLILLPREAQDWPAERLAAVLAHERAHVRRRDSLTQVLAQLVCAFYWPNLLLWLGARSLCRLAEIAADDAVLMSGMRASDYAAQLLQLAGERRLIAAAAMAAPSLEARVKSVLSPTPLRTGVSVMDGLKIAWLGSAAVVALALVRPALAEVQEPTVVQASPLPAPVAAPAPAAAPAPMAQAAPVADVIPPAPPARHHHHPRISPDQARLTPDEKAQMDAVIAHVHATMDQLRPQIEQAVAQAHANQKAAQAVQQAMPQIHAAIAQAMAKMQPALHQVFVDERLDVKVSVELDKAQAKIDADMARAERDVAHAAAHTRERAGDAAPDPGNANP